jgi:hypothetical protein
MKVNTYLKWGAVFVSLSAMLFACSPESTDTVTGSPTPTLTATEVVIDPLLTPIEPSQTPAPTFTPTPTPDPTTNVMIPRWGVENHNANPALVEMMKESGFTMVRRNALRWAHIEPEEGNINWEAAERLEQDLQRLSQAGMEVILIVHTTPPWAQQAPGIQCSAVREEKLEAFADFMYEAVSRYSYPPYNVKFWELGNEPDVAPHLIPPEYPFGCWGDEEDDFYGGGHYAEMLKFVYPAIKLANPEVQVLVGGLLLDCDPSLSPDENLCPSAKFIEGILRSGGGDYFDIMSYHGYALYFGSLQLDPNHPNWEHRSGVVLGKAEYLRELFSKYEIDKPIIHSEGGLICPEGRSDSPNRHCNPPQDAFFEAQADYIIWLYVRDWATGIDGTVWYQFEGPAWRHANLLTANQEETPALRAFQFLTEFLGDAEFIKKVDAMGALQIYEFASGDKRIWVAWPSDEQAYTIQMGEDVKHVLDKYGEIISIAPDEITIENPVYIEFLP